MRAGTRVAGRYLSRPLAPRLLCHWCGCVLGLRCVVRNKTGAREDAIRKGHIKEWEPLDHCRSCKPRALAYDKWLAGDKSGKRPQFPLEYMTVEVE